MAQLRGQKYAGVSGLRVVGRLLRLSLRWLELRNRRRQVGLAGQGTVNRFDLRPGLRTHLFGRSCVRG
jgi:hypothetical protein